MLSDMPNQLIDRWASLAAPYGEPIEVLLTMVASAIDCILVAETGGELEEWNEEQRLKI